MLPATVQRGKIFASCCIYCVLLVTIPVHKQNYYLFHLIEKKIGYPALSICFGVKLVKTKWKNYFGFC